MCLCQLRILFSLRNCIGDIPVMRLKQSLKYVLLEKPASAATSVIFSFEPDNIIHT